MTVLPEVAVIVGTRPDAIKLAPVIGALRRSATCRVRVIATGQHQELLSSALDVFGIVPDVRCEVHRATSSLSELTSELMRALGSSLEAHPPAITVVQGDTTSALCGALASFYARVPVAHVEAGLRTGDATAPFPEEINRRLISALAVVHFAPTESAHAHLLREGVLPERVMVTGNTVVDAVHDVWARVQSGALAVEPILGRRAGHRCVLVTGHRRENIGAAHRDVCAAIDVLASAHPEIDVIVPVHPNPSVRDPMLAFFAARTLPNVLLVSPLPYPTFVALMAEAALIITDSGGVQEEAPTFGTPVLVTRAATERPEGLHDGANRVVGTDAASIVAAAEAALGAAHRAAPRENPYGDGAAAARIVARLERAVGVAPSS